MMELTCPYIIWRISPFSSTNHCVTKPFKFFDCDWRWEYSVHARLDNEESEEVASIFLKRLTNSSVYSSHKFSTVVSIMDTDGIHHTVKVLNREISPLVSWCAWRKSKSSILRHNIIENNSCTFSLTFEPFKLLDDFNSVSNDENHDVSCLQDLRRDFDKLLKYSKHPDIILKCNNTDIKAHKDVLCFRSKKFTNIIEKEDNFENTSTENLKIITLPSMDDDIFIILLRFIYTSALPDLTNELARELYKAADEYSISSLKKKCAQFIIENLCNFDALEMLIFAIEHEDEYLKWAVSSHIASDLNILNGDEWKTFSNKNKKFAIDVFKIFAERANDRAYTEMCRV